GGSTEKTNEIEIGSGSNEKTNEIEIDSGSNEKTNEIEIDSGSNEKTNEIGNESKNTKSGKRKVIDIIDDENARSEKSKFTKSPSVMYGLFEDEHTYIIILHTPGIANKSDLIISTVNDKLINIDGNFSEKVVPGRTIINFLPIGPLEAEVELPSEIEATSAKVEIEHRISTITLKKRKNRKIS
ncbi:hypothetical protein C1645_825369, partial [Glomus cerebriforme]